MKHSFRIKEKEIIEINDFYLPLSVSMILNGPYNDVHCFS